MSNPLFALVGRTLRLVLVLPAVVIDRQARISLRPQGWNCPLSFAQCASGAPPTLGGDLSINHHLKGSHHGNYSWR